MIIPIIISNLMNNETINKINKENNNQKSIKKSKENNNKKIIWK